MIQFGLRLHDAEKLPLEQVLPLVRQKGFTCAHVALSNSFRALPCTPSAQPWVCGALPGCFGLRKIAAP